MEGREKQQLFDGQGNPVDSKGKLILVRVKDLDEISNEEFSVGYRNVELPEIPKNLDEALGALGRSVIIKSNIFTKNAKSHPELSSTKSREILKQALYSPDMYGSSQPKSRPDYKVVIHQNSLNAIVILDVFVGKENLEIVGWRQVDSSGLEKLKRQAAREDGQLLILSPINGSAADLSTLPGNLSFSDKDNVKKTSMQ
ncbi:MAG: hypothetical protein J6T04_03405 [Bacteroidales bacterium]|nr:hypothetical protein [Bacteroidales bacterium]